MKASAIITLYGFGPSHGLPGFSPFVVKANLLLKFSALPYCDRLLLGRAAAVEIDAALRLEMPSE